MTSNRLLTPSFTAPIMHLIQDRQTDPRITAIIAIAGHHRVARRPGPCIRPSRATIEAVTAESRSQRAAEAPQSRMAEADVMSPMTQPMLGDG